jgi:hypothetical protein
LTLREPATIDFKKKAIRGGHSRGEGFMRTVSVILALPFILSLLAPSAVAEDSTADQGGENTFHLQLDGRFGIASWTTAPAHIPVGTTYTETFVAASTLSRELDSPDRTEGPTFFMEKDYCTKTAPRETSCTETAFGFSDTFFGTNPADVTVSIDRALERGHAQGTFDFAQTCTIQGDCTDLSGASFEARWRGTGTKETTTFQNSCEFDGGFLIENDSNTSRPASATATIEGVSIPGHLDSARLGRSRSVEVDVGQGFCF